jgi:serine/threonine-protein kinase
MSDHNTQTIRRIGPYNVLNEIGRGAMGVVYRAFDPTIGRELAIKTLYVPRFAEESQLSEARQRFVLEAQAAGRLSHPNIVVIYQFGQEQDFQYLAMELIPGASLDKLMAGGRVWTPAEIAGIVGQTAAALDFAHANQVIHRDIKPGNIMVRPDGVVKVTDFGIARVSEQILTTAGTWGTPVYMAPERIGGERGDGRADQYALAVVAYQLVSNDLPFGKTGDLALLHQILQNEPARLQDARLDRAIRRALAKDPAKRYPTCTDFAAALQEALAAGPDVLTKRTALPLSAPLPAPVARRPAKRWGGFVLLLLLLAVAGVAAFFLHRGFVLHPGPGEASRPVPALQNEPAPAVHVPVRKDAVLIEKVDPARPFFKKLLREKGVVRFSATVTTDGRLTGFVLLSGPKGLVAAARKAAEKWVYQPATEDGQPVEQTITIVVDFRN